MFSRWQCGIVGATERKRIFLFSVANADCVFMLQAVCIRLSYDFSHFVARRIRMSRLQFTMLPMRLALVWLLLLLTYAPLKLTLFGDFRADELRLSQRRTSESTKKKQQRRAQQLSNTHAVPRTKPNCIEYFCRDSTVTTLIIRSMMSSTMLRRSSGKYASKRI